MEEVLFHERMPGVFGINSQHFSYEADGNDFGIGSVTLGNILPGFHLYRGVLLIQVVDYDEYRSEKVFQSNESCGIVMVKLQHGVVPFCFIDSHVQFSTTLLKFLLFSTSTTG